MGRPKESSWEAKGDPRGSQNDIKMTSKFGSTFERSDWEYPNRGVGGTRPQDGGS